MRIRFLPQSGLGKFAVVLSIIFIILFAQQILTDYFHLPGVIFPVIGVAGFIAGIIAIVNKDRSVGTFFPVLVGLGIFIVIAAIGISSLGLFKDFDVKDSLNAEETGDIGNEVVNFGSISQKDGWIYYIYKDNLYKRKPDWTEKTKVSESKMARIYISGDWIYFQDSWDGGNLFKMKTDGTGHIKISDDQIGSFTVSGQWIFYNPKKTTEEEAAGGGLYKIRVDGTEKVKLLDEGWDLGNLKILGDWIYYNEYETAQVRVKSNLYRIKTDGTEKSLVVKDAGIEYISGDWVYYVIRSDEGKGLEKITICRINGDETEKSEIVTLNEIYGFWFDHDWFYFTSGKGLSRIKLDGTGKEKLNDVNIWALEGVSGNWMYISDYAGPRFRVKLDGSIGTRLN